MGLFDRRNRKQEAATPASVLPQDTKKEIAVGSTESTEGAFASFTNSNITFSGDLKGYNYDTILRDKQSKINELYQLSDYFVDADPIYKGVIKHVYVPYSICSEWKQFGVSDKTRRKYEEWYEHIHLRDKMKSIFLQYFKYANVYVYYMDGHIITQPVDKCRIGNVALNGEPIVEYDVQSIINEFTQNGFDVKRGWIHDNDLEVYFKGYPPEVVEAIDQGYQWAQLNPENTHVMQGEKEDWQRYAIPFVASCLNPLRKKALIGQYEDALQNLGLRSFVHVTYGDPSGDRDLLPDSGQLRQVRQIFSNAMSGYPLAVTNNWVKADIKQADTKFLFEWNKYKEVNDEILSAGGISGIIVSGVSDDGSTFASAQVSMQTAATRIQEARKAFCEMMDKLNHRMMEDMKIEGRRNFKDVPSFRFMPLDMQGVKSLQNTCETLWKYGLVSDETMLNTHGYSLTQEKELRMKEIKDGVDNILAPRETQRENALTDRNGEIGRPQLTDDERTSDPENAQRGKMPKPSSPEGSLE